MSTERKLDIREASSRLEALRGREYWRSLEELLETEDFREHLHREFRVPVESGFDRRELLTLMGASIALAGLTGCTRQPTESIFPYVRPPEDMVTGEPLYYATAQVHGGYARGVVVESYEGRPIKIEGNELHPASLGGTDVFAQGFLLNMYDPDRSQTLTERGEIRAWSSFLAAVKLALEREREGRGAGLRFLTGTVTSPTLQKQLADILAAYPEAKWVSWEPAGRDNVAEGACLAFGQVVEPRYALDEADVILSLEADFLGAGPAMPRTVRDFASRRRAEGTNRLYVVESTPTLTGAKADHRRPMRPAEIAAFARAVASAVGAITAAAGNPADPFAAAVAADLSVHRGSSLVVAGESQPPEIHALAHAMNETLGNAGVTVSYTDPAAGGAPGQAAALAELVSDMQAGRVGALVIVGGNPVFTAPADLAFAKAMDRVALRIHLGLYNDETSRLCHWHVAEAHSLESWSDARSLHGTVTILQPLIAPLFGGKSAHELLAAFSDEPEKSGHDLVKEHWRGKLPGADFETAWRKALHDGVVEDSAFPTKPVRVLSSQLSALSSQPSSRLPTPDSQLTLLFRPDPTIWDGSYANNGWLQELPKPLTKLTWDNAAMIAPSTAQRLGVATEDVVELSFQGRKVLAPVWVLPGQAEDCVTVHFGYGRTRGGHVANGVGFDAYAVRSTNALWAGEGLRIAKTLRRAALATTQHHHSMEGRALVRSVTAEEYRRDPEAVAKLGEAPPGPRETMYPPLPAGSYAWGMSIDLSACVGCNACVIACQAENNIPVVGKREVARGRAMQWIRIDRYYTGGLDNPGTVHQPVTCMHCENAPCEVVCPVAATTHSAEGLNQMIYNRCVGTRYCSNNCPYKVRRFNYFLYSDFTTEIVKMVRNPEVTVRSRGVMEKCSYCVQRINRARYAAEKQNRPIADGEIVTACQQACPAQAIVFGNIADSNARVSKAKAEKREYGLLTELGTRPRTTYLASISNPNPALPVGRKPGEGHES